MILWVGHLGWVHLDGSLLAFDGLIHVSLTTVSWAALFHGGREHVCMCVCVYVCVCVCEFICKGDGGKFCLG